MRIVTWNINSIRYRFNLLKKLIEEQNPDIICLQETKVIDELFPFEDLKSLGYPYIYFAGQKSYHGVAVISKFKSDNIYKLDFCNNDKRHIAIKINNIELHNFYIPAGGDIPDINLNPKFKHKIDYIERITKWFEENRSDNDQLIILGDFNVAPHENDVWSSKQLRNVVSHTEIERVNLLKLQKSLNFIDTGRFFVPTEIKQYTWWSYRNIDWEKSNRGRRLDHIWVSNNLSKQLDKINILTHARNWPLPSDHVPYVLDIFEK